MTVKYQTLDKETRINIANDRLRQLEAEHFRATVAAESPGVGVTQEAATATLKQIEEQVTKIQKMVADIQKEK